jgi:nucleotide-binding universal stress UspA family protein
MKVAVAFERDGGGKAAVHLGALLARSANDDLIIGHVDPASPFDLRGRFEDQHPDIRNERAELVAEAARALVPDDVRAVVVTVRARSAAAGLVDLCAEHAAIGLVVGSSDSAAFGRIAVGGLAERLLHTSSVPVALAPRGYRTKPGSRVTRVTVAYDGSDTADDLVRANATVAARTQASIRLLVLDIDSPPTHSMAVRSEGDAAVALEWETAMNSQVAAAVDRLRQTPTMPEQIESVVGVGATWRKALDNVDWADGDVLVTGSSSIGPVARVFLGSRSAKIIRSSPVPVIVVPRSAASQLVPDPT